MANDLQLNPNELDRAKDFLKKHRTRCKKADQYSLRFTQTGIGAGVTIKCRCGKQKDITDTSCW